MGVEMDQYRTLGDLVEANARNLGDMPATIFEDRTRSHGALANEARNIAAHFAARGLTKGSRVAYLGRNHDRMAVLLIACGFAGCVFTPINWRLSDEELDYVVGNCEASLLFHSREHGPYAAASGLDTVDVDDDAAWQACVDADVGALPAIDPDDILLQIYSSGTTGKPKGVELTHSSVLRGAQVVHSGQIGSEWTTDDRMLIVLPLFHVSALLMLSFSLTSGAGAIILRDAIPAAIADMAQRHGATRIGLVPALIQLIVDSPTIDMSAFASLKLVIYGGSSITPALLARAQTALDCGFLQLFGMSETFTSGTVLGPEEHRSGDAAVLGSCGKPLDGVTIRIVDEDGADLPPGEPGEILIRCDTLMKGYWRLPEETAAVLDDGWYRTGDVGSRDASGYLTIRDRIRDMVISGGENVYPAEVEAALASHESVGEIAVIGRPCDRWGEAVTAVVVPKPDRMVDEAELIAYARGRIAHYKCPSKVIIADELPKNAGGKVLKRVLRERYC
jgi:fatty-acyl-CoA synthase/long-chain acyl-CoA synthetase